MSVRTLLHVALLLLLVACFLALREDRRRRAAAEEAQRAEKEADTRYEAQRREARDEAAPAAFDATVAANAAVMIDEDEAMVEAIEEYMDGHPDLKRGRPLDSYAVERQVPGPGGTVVASVAASAGTAYFDYVAFMTRGSGGKWTVQKVEAV